MKLELRERNAEHVRIYFERTQDDQIDHMLPRSVASLERALENFEQTRLPDAKSYGRTIYMDDRYIGDIWCCCIDPGETPNAMLSYCIFEKDCWGRGAASLAVSLFLDEIKAKYPLTSMGAFTFADNAASIRVLEKNGFAIHERFTEDGRESCYLERSL